jgi:hypothetical protein
VGAPQSMSTVNRRILGTGSGYCVSSQTSYLPEKGSGCSLLKKYKVYFSVRISFQQIIILLIHTFYDINLISSYLILLLKKLIYYY